LRKIRVPDLQSNDSKEPLRINHQSQSTEEKGSRFNSLIKEAKRLSESVSASSSSFEIENQV